MYTYTFLYVFFIVALRQSTEAGSQKGHWSYSGTYGPSNWSTYYPDCEGNRQSPVDIVTSNTLFDSKLDPLQLSREEVAEEQSCAIVNNGHSVSLEQLNPVVRITGGNLVNSYRVAGVHFHWGKNETFGSEHTINGKHFPLEMHLVSYNDHYDSLSTAVKASNGLAVIGLLFQISPADNLNLKPIIGVLRQLKEPGQRVNISQYDITSLLPTRLNDYFRYNGSLTTPPCYESVTWTVLRQASNVSLSQLEDFASIRFHADAHEGSHELSSENWRPTQPLNSRIVYRSFADRKSSVESEFQQPAFSTAQKNSLDFFKISLFFFASIVVSTKQLKVYIAGIYGTQVILSTADL